MSDQTAILVALMANIAVIIAAWFSSHKKLTHITKVTNSNLEDAKKEAATATAKSDTLEEKIHDLRDGDLTLAIERIEKLEARLQEPRDE